MNTIISTKILFVAIFLCTVFAPSLFALDVALDLGDSFFSVGNYNAAITEFKRFLFFNPHDPRAGDAHFKIGLAHRADGGWSEAAEAMRTAIQSTPSSDLKVERRVELAVTLIANGEYELALIELLKAEPGAKSETLRRRLFFLQGIAYLYLFNWEEAQQVFDAYFDVV